MKTSLYALASALVLFGCGDDGVTSGTTSSTGAGGTASTTVSVGTSTSAVSSSSSGAGGSAPFEVALDWYTCPFVTGQTGQASTIFATNRSRS